MKPTHTGTIVGCDARTAPDYKEVVKLRETKTLWIDRFCRKYSKKNGYPSPRRLFPMYRLQLDTIKPIE